MKKIFKIASYDFKRLLKNPITIVSMIIVLAACLITSFVYKIPTTPAYSCNIQGQTTTQVYENFMTSKDANQETKISLNQILIETKNLIKVQDNCQDYALLHEINEVFKAIEKEVKKFGNNLENKYTTPVENIDEIKNEAANLKNFIIRYKSLEEFQSNLIFTTKSFQELEEISTFFSTAVNQDTDVRTILNGLYENVAKFEALNNIVENQAVTWKVDVEKLQQFQTDYIDKAEAKVLKIEKEMERLNNSDLVTGGDTKHIDEMKSLATNYKLTCESAKVAVMDELRLILNNHFKNLKNLYNYSPVTQEDIKAELTTAIHFLEDEGLYYTAYQVPLNFNTASSVVTVYDKAYFMISIVGFLNILFGIFCAYKLFGRDRKNGKMDIILSQNVSFGQVFAGKFLAIVLITSFMLLLYSLFSLLTALLFHPTLAGQIFAVFNLSSVYTLPPFIFLLIKILGLELQVIFYSVITVFLMNVSRKFELFFAIAVLLFAVATICNIFLNGSIVYCLFPFIHADLTSFLGGATMNTGFLKTSLYAYGNFFISLVYYLVIVVLLYNFTKQLFKKN